jgi:heterodisulfide reductase subunit C2
MTQIPIEGKEAIEPDIRIFGAEISPEFADAVRALCGENVSQCYQCGECTAGCPAAFAMPISPNRVMRMAQLGMEKTVLASETIWLCAGCETCATRCPRGLSVAKVMDACREMAAKQGVKSPAPNITIFHQEFLASVERTGRVFEMEMIGMHKTKTHNFFQDVPMGIKMFLKGKLSLLPSRIKGVGEVKKIFRKAGGK